MRSSSHTMSIRTLPPGSNISYKPSREIDHDYRIELGGSWESRSLGQWVCVYVCMVCFSGLALVCSIRHSVSRCCLWFGVWGRKQRRPLPPHSTPPNTAPQKRTTPKKKHWEGESVCFHFEQRRKTNTRRKKLTRQPRQK